MLSPDARAVLDFWFAGIDDTSSASDLQAAFPRWFTGGEALDDELRARFGELLERAGAGELDDWAETPEGSLALIVLVDQFGRNIHRGTAKMYAADGRALRWTLALLDGGLDDLPVVHRVFALMPLQHVEGPALQERSIVEYTRLAGAAPPHLAQVFRGVLSYAQRHRDVVARFGRFPHRNDILGRESTPEELEFLAGNPGGF